MLIENPVVHKNAILAIEDKHLQDVAVAHWGLEFIGDYKKKQYPPMPEIVKRYEVFDKVTKDKMHKHPEEYKNFWEHPEVEEYFDHVDRVNNLNNRNYGFLVWMKKILPEEASRIDQGIGTYELIQPVWND